MKENRLEWVDAIKGFAIILVVLGHCCTDSLTHNTFLNYRNLTEILMHFIYSFHMPLFFMVSGYVYWLSKDKINIRKSIFNLALIYFLWVSMTWAAKFVFASEVRIQVDYLDLLKVFYKPMQQLWYIYVLAIFYGLFYFTTKEMLKSKYILILACVALISKLFPYDLVIINRIAYHAVYFAFGGYMTKREIFKENGTFFYVVILIINFLFSKFINDINLIYISNIVHSGISSLLIFVIFYRYILPFKRLLSKIGFYCLHIYLLHIFIIVALRIVLNKIGFLDYYNFMILGTFLGVFIPLEIGIHACKLKIVNFLFSPGKYFSN